MENKIKALMNIPKRHTLRHYIGLVGELYGEPKESLKEYIEEQVVANEHQLDKAIECFVDLGKQAVEAGIDGKKV